MALQFITPADLPAATSLGSAASIPAQNGSEVLKATPKQIVDAGRPVASQAQAEAGTDNLTGMTPLTTRQAISAHPDVAQISSILARLAALENRG